MDFVKGQLDFVKGQLVRSKAGRDKARTLAVLDVQGPWLTLADGGLRRLGKPKRKKTIHVAATGTVLGAEQLQTDKALRAAIAAYDAAHPI